RGYVTGPAAGLRRRKQQWGTFHGSKQDAAKELNKLVGKVHRGEFVEPSKMTVREWLTHWLDTIVAPTKRVRTTRPYRAVVSGSLMPAIGNLKLQALTALDLQAFYASKSTRAPKTLRLYHCVISAALKSAVRQGLVARNVASLVEGLPRVEQMSDEIEANCWSRDEARTFLATAKAAGPRQAAFYAMALDSGARVGELCGLKWADLDLDAGTMCLKRQLVTPGACPQFGPP